MKRMFIFICCLLATLLTACSGGIGEKGISKEEFEQIEPGMKPSKVDRIVGGTGEKIEETEEDGNYTLVYKYLGEKGGYVIITYACEHNGYSKVQKIENHGLK